MIYLLGVERLKVAVEKESLCRGCALIDDNKSFARHLHLK